MQSLHYLNTIRDFMKFNDVRHVDVRLADWSSGSSRGYTRVFTFFGVEVTLYDLMQDKCAVRISQKLPTSSMRIKFYHSKYKMSFVFKLKSQELDKGYMDMSIFEFIAEHVSENTFDGMQHTGPQELMDIFGVNSGYIHKISSLNQQVTNLTAELHEERRANKDRPDIRELTERNSRLAKRLESQDDEYVSMRVLICEQIKQIDEFKQSSNIDNMTDVQLLNIINERIKKNLGDDWYKTPAKPIKQSAVVISILDRIKDKQRA